MKKLTFSVVGSGWRAEFYARIAHSHPDRFALSHILCRSEEKARLIRQKGYPATTNEVDIISKKPDFVVVAVSKGDNFDVTRHWLSLGFPVLAETPAGCSFEELCALWELYQKGARLTVAEQYFRYPLIAAGLREVRAGRIGEPHAVTLSLCHDYHAASVIRRMLGMESGPLRDFTVTADVREYPVERTDSRFGPITDGSVAQSGRVTADFAFDNGKRAYYDFDGIQYHTRIRARHIDLRGQRGQWYDTTILFPDETHIPRRLRLTAAPIPGYETLTTPELEKLAGEWNPFVHMENAQDEYAIATLMDGMEAFIAGGPDPYPLREALEDAYTWLLMGRSIDTHAPIKSGPRPWQA